MVSLTRQGEYPPLLEPGFHVLALPELRQLCVDPFADSETREPIMQGVEHVTNEIENASIQADIWVNGSFLTGKKNPNDSDIVVKVSSDLIDNGAAEQQRVLKWINTNLKDNHLCDSYLLPVYPDDDPLAVLNDYNRSYWLRQFGFSRGNNYKGIAVVRTGAST